MKRSTAFLDATMMALATVLGVGSVALFAACASGIFKGVRMPWTESTLLLWDAALSLAFFVQHSGMVRKQFRTHLAGLLPERYQGTFYSIVSGIVLTLVALLWQHSDNSLLQLQGLSLWIARGCTVLALAILVWSAIALRSFDLLGLVPVKAHLREKQYQAFPFTVRGPYRWVRHPVYFSVIVLFWSTPVLTTDRLLFNVLWTAWIIVGTVLEERDLTAEFGDAYRDYQKKVPMLIPLHGPVSVGH
jgi:protein-S-isoprenylcysteine O-methyltransferase Ste14